MMAECFEKIIDILNQSIILFRIPSESLIIVKLLANPIGSIFMGSNQNLSLSEHSIKIIFLQIFMHEYPNYETFDKNYLIC
jgi:hypothetical protein